MVEIRWGGAVQRTYVELGHNMKVMVEISDEQVVAFLRECIHTVCHGAAHDLTATLHPLETFRLENLARALEICKALNRTIEFLGAGPVDASQTINNYIEQHRGQDNG
jgi:hypothetical protein